MIRAHHETFDGKGYPDGLAGDAIPWPARCLAVAVGFVESGLPKAAAIDSSSRLSGTGLRSGGGPPFPEGHQPRPPAAQVREITLHELEPGMVLANGIYSPHGLLLIGEGQALSPSMIAKIRIHNQVTPISQRLLVRI